MAATLRGQLNWWQQTTREIFDFHWRPDRHTWIAACSYLLAVGCLFTAFRIVTTAHVALNFILFGPVTLAGIGIALPVLYTIFYKQGRLTELGLTTRHLLASLLLSILLGWDTYRNTLGTLDFSWDRGIVPLVAMAVTVGLFEAVFFRGWLQLRFEEAFGILPGILLGAGCYAFYHIGYGMTASEMVFLLWIGLVFAAAFRITKNILVLWPLYTPIGGLFTNLTEGLTLPYEATYGFALVLVVMAVLIFTGARIASSNRQIV